MTTVIDAVARQNIEHIQGAPTLIDSDDVTRPNETAPDAPAHIQNCELRRAVQRRTEMNISSAQRRLRRSDN